MAQTLHLVSELPKLDEHFSAQATNEPVAKLTDDLPSPDISSSTASDGRPVQAVGEPYPQTSEQASSTIPTHHTTKKQKQNRVKLKDRNRNVINPDDPIGEPTDATSLVTDFLPAPLASTAFTKLQSEVRWQTMHHRGGEVPRLVAVEGEMASDGSFPIYRHPADESPPLLPFSRTVGEIRQCVEEQLGQKVNHVLIQWYRGGGDYISEHSDKTLDIKAGSVIVNVSLGARRVMTLRTKKPKPVPTASTSVQSVDAGNGESNGAGAERTIQKVPLPHNSMFILALPTNQRWTHAINRDLRPDFEKDELDLSDGGRISLTFRLIDTFLSADEEWIWGQGAKGKTRETAGRTISGDEDKGLEMIIAFGMENSRTEFDWEAVYGGGFDVLHVAKKDERKTATKVQDVEVAAE